MWLAREDRSYWLPTVATDTHAPTADTAAVITYTADSLYHHCIRGVCWSYSAAPTNGLLTISLGGTTVLSFSITVGGPGFIPFPIYLASVVNSAMVITLAAGGGTVVGKVNALGYIRAK